MQCDTAWGPVVGRDDAATNGTWSWKGVPFARPPVGSLRWRAPQDPVAANAQDVHANRGTAHECRKAPADHVQLRDMRPDARWSRFKVLDKVGKDRQSRG